MVVIAIVVASVTGGIALFAGIVSILTCKKMQRLEETTNENATNVSVDNIHRKESKADGSTSEEKRQTMNYSTITHITSKEYEGSTETGRKNDVASTLANVPGAILPQLTGAPSVAETVTTAVTTNVKALASSRKPKLVEDDKGKGELEDAHVIDMPEAIPTKPTKTIITDTTTRTELKISTESKPLPKARNYADASLENMPESDRARALKANTAANSRNTEVGDIETGEAKSNGKKVTIAKSANNKPSFWTKFKQAFHSIKEDKAENPVVERKSSVEEETTADSTKTTVTHSTKFSLPAGTSSKSTEDLLTTSIGKVVRNSPIDVFSDTDTEHKSDEISEESSDSEGTRPSSSIIVRKSKTTTNIQATDVTDDEVEIKIAGDSEPIVEEVD